MTSAIEQELCKVTNIKKKKSEDNAKYLERLIDEVQSLPDDDWESLSSAAQHWVNDGARAINSKDPISAFPDADEDEAEGDGEEAEEAEEAEAEAPKKAKGKGKAKTKPKAKKKAAEPASEPKSATGLGGAKYRIKKLLLEDPNMKAEDIISRLSDQGDTPSKFTVVGIRAEFRHSLKVLKAEGLLPDVRV